MAQYKVTKPLIKTSEKKLYKPGETVELSGDEEKVALLFHAVEVVPQPVTQAAPAQPSSTVTSQPAVQAKTVQLSASSTTTAPNTPAKTGDAK